MHSLRTWAITGSFDRADPALKWRSPIQSTSILRAKKIIPPAQITTIECIAGEETAGESGRGSADISTVTFGSKVSRGRASSVIRLPKVRRGDCAGSLRPAIQTATPARSERVALLRRRDIDLVWITKEAEPYFFRINSRMLSISLLLSCWSRGSRRAATRFSGLPSKKVRRRLSNAVRLAFLGDLAR